MPEASRLRQSFRKFGDSVKRCTSKLESEYSDEELSYLSDFLGAKECIFAYKVISKGQYKPRDKKGEAQQKADSLFSKLCYRVNQAAVA